MLGVFVSDQFRIRNMKPEPTITITPSEYKGWKMEFDEHADGHNRQFFFARKGKQFVDAHNLKTLMVVIDKAEKLTVKFKTPIKCMMQLYGKWERLSVHTICGDTIYWISSEGEQGSEFLSNLKNEHRTLYLDTPENVNRINDTVKIRKKAEDLTRKADDLKKKWIKLTEADLMLAAKEGSK